MEDARNIMMGAHTIGQVTTGCASTPIGVPPTYYTPSLEDIRIGYECEFASGIGMNDVNWKKIVVNGGMFPTILRDHNLLRTSYLTKEQIEAEGWELYPHLEYGRYEMLQLKDKSWYVTLRPNLEIEIHNYESYEQRDTLFSGKCPSINEFRTIIKLIGIE